MIKCINTCTSTDGSLRARKHFKYDNYKLEMIHGEQYYRIWYGEVVTALYKKSNFTSISEVRNKKINMILS